MDSTLNLLSLTGGPGGPGGAGGAGGAGGPLALELTTIATLAGDINRLASISSLVCLRDGPGSGIYCILCMYVCMYV
jgi:hypothetical protein